MSPVKAYLGVDIGSISTKAVVIDDQNAIFASAYLWTEGNPIQAVRKVLNDIQRQLEGKELSIVAVGTTGSARELIGKMLEATIVKNEITAHAIGTLTLHPDVKTIFEIGGQDSKIIIIDQGIVVDYAMNTLCAAGTGSFLSSQARRLNIAVEEFGKYALTSTNPTKIAGRCTVFAESDLVHKAQMGYPLQDIIAGLCNSIVHNYLNNVGKGKNLQPPMVFQGGVSKNIGVVHAFERITGHKIVVDDIGHLMGAFGVAILARRQNREKPFTFNVKDIEFRTVGLECGGCANNCEIVCVLKEGEFLDGWGNRCQRGIERARERLKHGAQGENIHRVSVLSCCKSERTFLVSLQRPKGFSFKAGEYVNLKLPKLASLGTRECMRSLSLASSPKEDELHLAVAVSDSNFKRALAEYKHGDIVEVEGPYGDLHLHDDDRPAVFIAGGIGIAPFRSMIVEEAKKGWSKHVTLFYSVHTPEEAVFIDEFGTLPEQHFTAVLTATRSNAFTAPRGWHGENSRIDWQMLTRHVPDPKGSVFYVVGPPNMVSAMKDMLTRQGIEDRNIFVEEFTGYEADRIPLAVA